MRALLAAALLLVPPAVHAGGPDPAKDGDWDPRLVAPETLTIEIPPPAPADGVARSPLAGVELIVGGGLRLGAPYEDARQNPDRCVVKAADTVRFCVGPVRWPPGLARALAHANEADTQVLKDAGLLTRDARRVERKKPGKAGARASFQFSKR